MIGNSVLPRPALPLRTAIGSSRLHWPFRHPACVLLFEDRVFGFGPPAALRADAIAQHTLAHHADALEQPDAGQVLDRDVSLDPVQLQVREAEGDEACRHLGSEAAPRMGFVDADAEAAGPGR